MEIIQRENKLDEKKENQDIDFTQSSMLHTLISHNLATTQA
jgi:hypothetical protein